MSHSILNHSLFHTNIFEAAVFFPAHHGATDLTLHLITTHCGPSTRKGVCCRVTHAMRYFLTTSRGWFLRAIDDSWFNPDNLYTLVQQLSTFLNPRKHVVMKGHAAPDFVLQWGRVYLQGGAPILLSRAAVIHVLQYFPPICGLPFFPSDDTTFGLIANRSFPSLTDWGDVRWAATINSAQDTVFIRQWDSHVGSYFRSFNEVCSQNAIYLKPLNKIIGVHTVNGIVQGRQIVEMASLNWFPQDLMFEYQYPQGYVLCRNKTEEIRLASMDYLKEVTPLLTIADLNYSMKDLRKWGDKLPKVPFLLEFDNSY
jgi:hypothetical protein